MNKSFVLALATLAVFAAPSSVSARDYKTIMAPYTEQYGDWKKIRSAMRKRQKNGEIRTGDDWFVLAAMCNIEPPRGPSRIMNFANRSPCKDEVVEYFVKAGMEGTPEGFREAARIIETGEPAYLYASLAFQLSGTDRELADEALTLLENNRLAPEPTERAFRQAQGMAQQLRTQGVYTAGYTGSAGSSAAQEGYRSPPPIPRGGASDLSWLDFDNPRRCGWSRRAFDVAKSAAGFDQTLNYPTVPADVRVPGFADPIRSRITRPYGQGENVVQTFVDFRGRWNGLTVLGLTDMFLEESHGLEATGIRFAEPVREVTQVLRRLGFVVNADGSTREQVDKRDEYGNIDGVITTVAREGSETVFYCNEVTFASYGA